MLLLAGLGNPGAKYARNRHNIGFMTVDAIAAAHEFSAPRKRHSGEIREGVIADEKILLLKPMTFMNDSGRSVAEVKRFYKLEPDDIYVFYDELDLTPGKLRLKTGGGAAGHNGIRSIADHIGPDFHRIRLGIGHPGNRAKVLNYVLKDFTKSERRWLEPLIDAIAKHIGKLVAGPASTFANKVHLELNLEPPQSAPAPVFDTAAEKPAQSSKNRKD